MPPNRPPTADEMLGSTIVLQAMEAAWSDSVADDPIFRHEEGGWISMDLTNGELSVRRASPGSRSQMSLGNQPVVTGSVVVGTFHTHPNPASDGWESGPSSTDRVNSALTGVPWLIRAENGYHKTGPKQRRDGLAGPSGFPL